MAGNGAGSANGGGQACRKIYRGNASLEGTERAGLVQPAPFAGAAANGQADAHNRKEIVGTTCRKPFVSGSRKQSARVTDSRRILV